MNQDNDDDISWTIVPKSDQLNGDSLIAGAITVQITGTKLVKSPEQPLVLELSGGHMPYKPCLTMRRILIAAWGKYRSAYVGRWVTLYRDPTAKWSGKEVGGIRISHMSDIEKPLTLNLTETRGQKKSWRVMPIKAQDAKQTGGPTADLDKFLADADLTREDVDRWRIAADKPPLAAGTDEQRAGFAVWLAKNPGAVDEIRALIPAPSAPPAQE